MSERKNLQRMCKELQTIHANESTADLVMIKRSLTTYEEKKQG